MNTQPVLIPIAVIVIRLLKSTTESTTKNTTKNTKKTRMRMRQRHASVQPIQLQLFLGPFAGCQDRWSKLLGAILCQQWAC